MKIMVTGGMGFVGSHLCESLLKENHNLIILTKSFKKKHNVEDIKTKIKQEKIDITNFPKLGKSIEKNKPDVLIHLAGQTSHSKSFENPVHDVDVNAKSTLFMLQKIKELNIQSFSILIKPNSYRKTFIEAVAVLKTTDGRNFEFFGQANILPSGGTLLFTTSKLLLVKNVSKIKIIFNSQVEIAVKENTPAILWMGKIE